VIDSSLSVAIDISPNKLHSFDFAINLTADVTGSTILAILINRRGLDGKTFVFDWLRWLFSRGRTLEKRFNQFAESH